LTPTRCGKLNTHTGRAATVWPHTVTGRNEQAASCRGQSPSSPLTAANRSYGHKVLCTFDVAFCHHATSPFGGDPFTDSEFVAPTTLDLPELMAHFCYRGTYHGVYPADRESAQSFVFPLACHPPRAGATLPRLVQQTLRLTRCGEPRQRATSAPSQKPGFSSVTPLGVESL